MAVLMDEFSPVKFRGKRQTSVIPALDTIQTPICKMELKALKRGVKKNQGKERGRQRAQSWVNQGWKDW